MTPIFPGNIKKIERSGSVELHGFADDVLGTNAHPQDAIDAANDLFLLMFRGERLDFTRPALRLAADAALDVLAGTVRAVRDEPMQAMLTLPQAAQMIVAWSLVHGFAMLLLGDRL